MFVSVCSYACASVREICLVFRVFVHDVCLTYTSIVFFSGRAVQVDNDKSVSTTVSIVE